MSSTSRKAERTATCAFCSTPFTTIFPAKRFCSVRCQHREAYRRKWASGCRRRFPHFSAAQRRRVADRDGWRCGLCGAAIDPTLKYPHRGSLSIDHIDPDGEHVAENWQASHLACNLAAGRKAVA